jgi:phytoene dehydrogenase-like protein
VASLLAHAGRRVALVEKTKVAGGKMQTVDRKGYRFEMFGAVGIPGHESRFHELVDVTCSASAIRWSSSFRKAMLPRFATRRPSG